MTELQQLITSEIRSQGPIPFSRFMQLALYTPALGYYERERAIGRSGDFYTSVSVGEVFGQLLAQKFSEWLEPTGGHLIETGAHGGQLARDILCWIRDQRPELYARIAYTIVEPSPTRRAWQGEVLREFESKVSWSGELPKEQGTMPSILFSNELLDAMPVDRLRWNKARSDWDELRVGLVNDQFAWDHVPITPALVPHAPEIPAELAAVLPDGYSIEISIAALNWWRSAAASLRSGWLVAFDYGFSGTEMFAPHRMNGTVRSYVKHRVTDDVLSDPGERDITAHVDFGAIQRTGESAGLQTELYASQGKFLADIAAKRPSNSWTPAQMRQFQTLIHPEHLGRAFKVLIQKR